MSGIAGAVKSGFDAAVDFIKGLPSQGFNGIPDGSNDLLYRIDHEITKVTGFAARMPHKALQRR